MIDSRNQSKRLGQHFLVNKTAIKKIIAALDLSRSVRDPAYNNSSKSVAGQENDTIIEIGPGRGALTWPLSEACKKIGCRVLAIERDLRFVKAIELGIMNYELSKTLKIISGDVLKILPALIHDSSFIIPSWKLVGNIPYYITGKLLRILGELENKPKIIVLTIQREVAERICAHPTKTCPTRRKCPMCGMNLLAAAVQIWAEPEIISYLKAKDFSPPPKVDSAIIKLSPKFMRFMRSDLVNYYRLIKLVFRQPRKTVLNNLSTGLNIGKDKVLEMLKKAGLEGTERPQNLSLSQILLLCLEL